ncbi:NAD(P)H-dependent oxidoreductase [Sphingomonas sp. MS122]|uniref:NAD(P)H-dependent oxidoreductase n=1 Tax=Sphingomonas sp. MS122 TaxID=3412683 RepID=UPI003C2EA50E
MTTTTEAPRHMIVLGHPTPRSFNHQVAETYQRVARECWQEAEVRDLYALNFDPLLRPGESPSPDIEAELAMLQACDVLVFVYPIWFGTPPAIIKGYVERVLGANFRPQYLKTEAAAALFHGKRFLTLSSSATSLPWLNERGQWLSLRHAFDAYLANLFGFREAEHVHFESVVEGTRESYIAELLGRVEQTARFMCSELAQERNARVTARHLGWANS